MIKKFYQNPYVAPFAGAWIETKIASTKMKIGAESLPSRERGLKRFCGCIYYYRNFVAPFAGAWIETFYILSSFYLLPWSLPSRERGLKLS